MTYLVVPNWVVAVGWALALVGFAAAFWAVFGDQLRRRRVKPSPACPKCRYDMRAATSTVCPECGHDAGMPANLLRPRRRWRRAGLLICVGVLGMIGITAERLAAIDWVEYLPTWAIVALVEDPLLSYSRKTGPTLNHRLVYELWERNRYGQLTLEQRRHVAAREFSASRPPVILKLRSRWPRDIPIRFAIESALGGAYERTAEVSIPALGVTRLHLQSPSVEDLGDSHWIAAEIVPEYQRTVEGGLREGPVLPIETRDIELHVDITELGERLWSGTLHAPIEIVDRVDQVMSPISNAELDTRFAEGLAPRIRLFYDQEWLWFSPPPIVEMGGVACGARFEILCGASVIAEAEARWRYDETGALYKPLPMFPTSDRTDGLASAGGPRQLLVPLRGDLQRIATADFTDGSWTVRIYGDGNLVVSDFDVMSYWSGDVTIAGNVLAPGSTAE